jgi:hypothetical protein
MQWDGVAEVDDSFVSVLFPIGLLLVADAELFRLEAIVRWLDAADARLRHLPTPAPVPVPVLDKQRRVRAAR